MIDDGMFAWAVRERKGVFTLNQSQQQTLLHVISNYSGVKGMFIGVLEDDQQEIAQSSLIPGNLYYIQFGEYSGKYFSLSRGKKTKRSVGRKGR